MVMYIHNVHCLIYVILRLRESSQSMSGYIPFHYPLKLAKNDIAHIDKYLREPFLTVGSQKTF